MVAIPASQIVSVVPSVIGGGGSALDLSGLILTNSTRVPINAVLSFPDAASVGVYFGPVSQEAQLANIYFLGFDGSTVKPGALLFAQYPAANVGAWLRGGNLASMTLTALQALSGTLSVTVDGVVKTAGSLSLAAATSNSSAAALIATGLSLTPLAAAAFTGSIATTTLTVSAVASGTIAAGQTLVGAGVTGGTLIVAQLTGATGGIGTYTVSVSQTISSESMTTTSPACAYDSQSGSFTIYSSTTGASSTMTFASGTLAAPLLLTQATGAVLSQGAIAGVPATNMDKIVATTADWATFMTTWEPNNAAKLAFSAWCNAQGNQYMYVLWGTDATPTTTNNDTSSAGYLIQNATESGTALVYESGPLGDKAAFVLGYAASIDFTATNGRATAKFRSQSGLAPDVTDGVVSKNLEANGWNFYGDWSTRNDDFIFLANGAVTGPFKWIDSYINQIWLNNAFQLALMSLLTTVKSIPYNQAGYSLIRAACLDPIKAALNFGAIRAGVTLSAAQAAEVNFQAGVRIDDVLNTQGWFLQIQDATAQVRAARLSPPCTFFYMDGQSVQRIILASVEVQ